MSATAELRASRTAVRRAHTLVLRAITEWDEQAASGRQALLELSNLQLRQLHLPALQLDKLKHIDDLLPAAARALQHQLHEQQDRLTSVVLVMKDTFVQDERGRWFGRAACSS